MVQFQHAQDGLSHLLEVHGYTSPYHPAVTSGPSDHWAPAEGGEIEDLAIFIQRGTRRRRLPATLETELSEDDCFLGRIEEELNEQ